MTRCSRVAEQYGYSVEYDGMGDPPAERSDVGHCSQMALFLRKTSEEAGDVMASDEGGDTPYKQVETLQTGPIYNLRNRRET